jgi:hypothetical protein
MVLAERLPLIMAMRTRSYTDGVTVEAAVPGKRG